MEVSLMLDPDMQVAPMLVPLYVTPSQTCQSLMTSEATTSKELVSVSGKKSNEIQFEEFDGNTQLSKTRDLLKQLLQSGVSNCGATSSFSWKAPAMRPHSNTLAF